MRNGSHVAVVIPALNEEKAIGRVIAAIPHWVDDVVVVDNGSSDRTKEEALRHGARVCLEPRRGYGSACLAGIAQVAAADIILFMDGDFSDYPEEAEALVDPIVAAEVDLVIGSRVLGRREPGALTVQARCGNWLACLLMRWLWGARFTDLGPFRAIDTEALATLGMRDPDYGWTAEMQVKTVMAGLQVKEVPVSYRARVGTSKVSGTLRGVVAAGTKILWMIFLGAVGRLPLARGGGGRDRIVLFTRYPWPGKTKTRLIPLLGPEGAADLHRRMAERAVGRAQELAAKSGATVEVRYDGGNLRAMRRWLKPTISCRPQHSGDLGRRMFMAFRDAFSEKTERVLLIGTDCPGITASLLERGFETLRNHDLVLGPANDGGYYLIGLKRAHGRLFRHVPWGTRDVLARTLEIARSMGLSTALVDALDDVDRPEDLGVWEREQRSEAGSAQKAPATTEDDQPSTHSRVPIGQGRVEPSTDAGPSLPRISVIIPTLNEEESLPSAVANILPCDNVEIILVDGGSKDQTVPLAESLGLRVLLGPSRRSAQMNLAAAVAKGDVLLFLHADTRLPQDWQEQVEQELSDPGVSAGAFTLSVSGATGWLQVVQRLANFRARVLQMPYGDQALFLKADVFHQLGGFPDLPVMEDFELVRRLRRVGRIAIAPGIAVTSSRRWHERGILRTTAINQVIIGGYLLGISPSLLTRLRDSPRGAVSTDATGQRGSDPHSVSLGDDVEGSGS